MDFPSPFCKSNYWYLYCGSFTTNLNIWTLCLFIFFLVLVFWCKIIFDELFPLMLSIYKHRKTRRIILIISYEWMWFFRFFTAIKPSSTGKFFSHPSSLYYRPFTSSYSCKINRYAVSVCDLSKHENEITISFCPLQHCICIMRGISHSCGSVSDRLQSCIRYSLWVVVSLDEFVFILRRLWNCKYYSGHVNWKSYNNNIVRGINYWCIPRQYYKPHNVYKSVWHGQQKKI